MENIKKDVTREVEISILDENNENNPVKLKGNLRIDTAKEFDYMEQGNILNYVLEELSN